MDVKQPNPTAPAQATLPEPATLSLDQFAKYLIESGLLTAPEIKAIAAKVLPAQRRDAAAFSDELIRQNKLTSYQSKMLFQGKLRGLVMDTYVILDKIGQGGMGMVFKAQNRTNKQIVALKVLPPSFSKRPNSVQRFEREVRAAGKLNHTNIVGARDASQHRGVSYFVMEFVDGCDLSRLVKSQGPLSVAQSVDCICQAARGLAHAHQAGIIHRDIKPGNLLLSSRGVIKVLDMGLALVEEEADENGEVEQLTKDGMTVGTSDYMAPEQAMNTRNADFRSDIYSLGCTLYYLLVGKTLYTGMTGMEKLVAHRESPIPVLSSVRPDVPKALDAVFEKMVAKKPANRYPSIAQMVEELQKCVKGAGKTQEDVAVPLVSLAASITTPPPPSAGLSDTNVGGESPTIKSKNRLSFGMAAENRKVFLIGLIGGGAAGVIMLVVVFLILALTPASSPSSAPTARSTAVRDSAPLGKSTAVKDTAPAVPTAKK